MMSNQRNVVEALREVVRITELADSLQRPEISAAWREFLARAAESSLRGVGGLEPARAS